MTGRARGGGNGRPVARITSGRGGGSWNRPGLRLGRLSYSGVDPALSALGGPLEEQRLTRDRGDGRRLKRLGDQECRLRAFAGEEALRIGGNEDDRRLKQRQQFVHGFEA